MPANLYYMTFEAICQAEFLDISKFLSKFICLRILCGGKFKAAEKVVLHKNHAPNLSTSAQAKINILEVYQQAKAAPRESGTALKTGRRRRCPVRDRKRFYCVYSSLRVSNRKSKLLFGV